MNLEQHSIPVPLEVLNELRATFQVLEVSSQDQSHLTKHKDLWGQVFVLK